ncbi:hypothetical protein VNO77_06635 [Canavalia gladiata]|uniref:MADS-box domain-containing protein n=1 Tax=Canavalia gladiata TaxID=3824 RepID=A0AAN9QVQ3_CANGL
MSSVRGGNSVTKPNTGRRKIEIKKVEQKSRRHVTFSKRKLGLFNKLTELSILCQSETALIVTSQNGKLYSCGYPDADAVIGRYLTGGGPQRGTKKKQQEAIEVLRVEYEATQNQLKEEKKRLQEIKEAQESNSGFPSWWNHTIEEMGLDNLEQFKTSLELLKLNLVAAVQKDKFNSLPPMPLAIFPPPQMPNMSLFTHCYDGRQNQDYWGTAATATATATTSSAFPITGFGHY